MTTATTTTNTTNGVRVCARDDVHNMCIRRRRRPAGVAYVRRRPCRRRGAYMPPPPVGGTKGFARWGRPPPRTVAPAHPRRPRSLIFHLFILLYRIIILFYLYLFLHNIMYYNIIIIRAIAGCAATAVGERETAKMI